MRLVHAGVRAQVKKAATVIPRNSLIEANQSGLIAEPLIDITPQLPIPDYKARAGPPNILPSSSEIWLSIRA
jgi:hypothetical protein